MSEPMRTDPDRDERRPGGADDEAKYRALVENLPAVIYQVAPDDDRRTMYVSRHVETALGYSRDEWLDAKRQTLHGLMRERRRRDMERLGGALEPITLF